MAPVPGSLSLRRDRSVLLAASAVVLTVACTALGFTPAPLLVCVVVLLSAVLSRPFGWVVAVAFTPIALVATFMVLGQVYPDIGVPFVRGNLVVLSMIGLGAVGAMALGTKARPLPVDGRWIALAAGLVPAVCAAWLAAVRVFSTSLKLAWMMGNDSPFNLFTSRQILLDGGVDPVKHPSPAPGTSEIIALFTGPGRGAVAPVDLLQHDLVRTLQALVLATCALSFIGAVAVALGARGGSRVARIAVTVVVASLPWTWIMFGNATRFGFWNALLSTAVLATAWLAFAEADRHPTAASAAQALAGTALLPLWAPLVLAPALFGLLIVGAHWRAHLALRRWAVVGWLTPPAVLAWYYLVVLRPLFTSQGGALAADGAMFPIGKTTIQAVLVAGAALGFLAYASRGRAWELAGTTAVLVTGWIGLTYLVAQRADATTGPWGYYPAKFGWLIAYLGIMAGARAAAAVAMPVAVAGLRWQKAARVGAGALAPLLVLSAFLMHFPPNDPVPLSAEHPALVETPDWRAGSVFPLVSIAQDDGASSLDPAVETLLPLSSPREKHLITRYADDATMDSFANFWLFQQPLVQDNNDVRYFAYFLKADNPESLCSLMRTWGPGVQVTTRDRSWGRTLDRTCPDAGMDLAASD